MTPDRLNILLSQVSDRKFAGMTTDALLAVARIYVALCNLVSCHDLDAVYGDRRFYHRKLDALFPILHNRLDEEVDVMRRGRIIRAMFDLVCDPIGAIDFRKKTLCCAVADSYVRDFLKTNGEDPLEQVSVCDCIISLLYPDPDSGLSYMNYLQKCISEWISDQQSDGSWAGAPAETALARIEMLNRNSYMLLDKCYDDAVRRGFDYYRNSLPIPEEMENFDPTYLSTLGRLYDTAMQGNAFAMDKALAREIAEFMHTYSQSMIDRNDDWFYCISHVVHHHCIDLADRLQNAMLNIA